MDSNREICFIVLSNKADTDFLQLLVICDTFNSRNYAELFFPRAVPQLITATYKM